MTSAAAPATDAARRSRRRTRAAAALTVAGVALALGTPSAAQATSTELLEAHEMPPRSTDWLVTETVPGTGGDRFCLSNTMPEEQSVYRGFRTDLDNSGSQTVIRTRNEREARTVTRTLRAAVENCTEGMDEENPDVEIDTAYLGKVHAGDGGHVYGIATVQPWGAQDVHLFGVGRDGTRVTVVTLGEMGTLDTAPVKGFHKTMRTALHKLNH